MQTSDTKRDRLRHILPRRLTAMMSNRWFKAVCAVVMTAILGIWLLNFDPLAEITNQIDYNSTDYYDRRAYMNSDLPYDDNVVIVGTDNLDSRTDIANALRVISEHNPAAIGLDLIFAHPTEGDSAIIESLRTTPNLVLPVDLQFVSQDSEIFYPAMESCFADSLGGVERAGVNFIHIDHYGIERYYRKWYDLEDGSRLPGMALALVSKFSPEAAANVSRGDEPEARMNFTVARHAVIDASEFDDMDPEDIDWHFRDKIVLVGDVNNRNDIHNTIIAEDTPGIQLHAIAVSTILSGRNIAEAPPWVTWVVSVIFIALIIMIYSFEFFSRFTPFWLLFVKALLIVLVLAGGYWLYRYTFVAMEFTLILTVVFFAMNVCDLWYNFCETFKSKDNI